MKKKETYGIDTTLIKTGIKSQEHHGFVNFPLYRGSTVLYNNVEEMEKSTNDPLRINLPFYGRFGTPTSKNFEASISEIEGGYSAICTNSGLSAITTSILSFIGNGDHILISDSVYMPTRNFCDSLSNFGIEVEYYDPCIGSEIEQKIRVNTKIVFMESPGSSTFEVQDVPSITHICNQKKVVTIIDNTWATPVYFNPIKVGVDVVIHSATKYIMGHSDGLLGVIVCKDELIYSRIRKWAIRLGQSASDENTYLALRGLKTISTRLQKHQNQALILAEWFQSRKEVIEVIYPPLKEDKGHSIWKRDFTGASGLFSVLISDEYSKKSIDQMLNSLKLFGLGHGWGGFESLLVPISHPSTYRSFGQFNKGTFLRINVGLEDTEDLIADLEQAFSKLNNIK